MNVLVLTYWSFPDALVQTYTLPYVRMIRRALPAESRLYLFTADRAEDAALTPALVAVREALEAAGVQNAWTTSTRRATQSAHRRTRSKPQPSIARAPKGA